MSELNVSLDLVLDKATLQDETRVSLKSAFEKFYSQLNELKADANNYIVTSESQVDLMKEAGERRKKLVKVRTQGIDATHKVLKADSLAYSRILDEIKRTANSEIESLEDFYREQETFVQRKEEERIAALKIERNKLFSEVCDNPEMYAVELMPQEAFDNLVTGLKLAKEQKIEAERKAEEERIDRERLEQEERERVRLENERLKKEAEEREAAIAKERAEAEAKFAEERRLNDEREAKEKSEREAIAEKERKEAAEKLAAEQAEKQRLENELKAKQQAEQEAKDKAAADEEARLSMGDKAKFEELISDMEALKTKHSFKSAKFKKAHAEIVTLLDKIINHAISK